MALRIIVKSIEDLNEALKLCGVGASLSTIVFGESGLSLVECLARELPKRNSDFVDRLLDDTLFAHDARMLHLLHENMPVMVNSPLVCLALLGGIVRAGNSYPYPCGAPDGVTEDWEDEVFDAWLSVLGEHLDLAKPSDVKYPPDALLPRVEDVEPPTPTLTPGQVVAQTPTPTPV